MIRAAAIGLLLCVAPPALAQVGSWSNAPVGSILPADFTGEVIYAGNRGGTAAGALEIELLFSGDVVKGKYTSGSGSGTLSGRRDGSACRLFDSASGAVWAGPCNSESFAGSVRSPNDAPLFVFDTIGTATTDFRATERAQFFATAERTRTDALLNRLDSGAPADRLDAFLQLDARRWPSDSYRPGSLTGIKRIKGSAGSFAVQGSFPLGAERTGWARARFTNDRMICVEYSFSAGACHPVDRGAYAAPMPSSTEQR